MNTIQRVIIFIIVSNFAVQFSFGSNTNTSKTVYTFLEVAGIHENFDEYTKTFNDYLSALFSGKTNLSEEIVKEASSLPLTWDDMIEPLAEMYTGIFSEEELKELILLYQQPVMHKYVGQLCELNNGMYQVAMNVISNNIMNNPDNTVITKVVGLTEFETGTAVKNANYIDVHSDYLDLYFERGNRVERVSVTDLEHKGNLLEQFLEEIYKENETEYIVLLIRPKSAQIYRRLRNSIRGYGIDLGMELLDTDKEVFFKDGQVAEKLDQHAP